MKRLFLITAISALTIFISSGQINKQGNPFIRNYSPTEVDASDRNWAIVQDQRGVIYVGNDDRGVLEFDGKTWRKIPVPNNSPVRSLAIDKRDVIYVGAVNELGYLAPDDTGLMQYHSLMDLLDENEKEFGDVWKTYVVDDEVYFCPQNRTLKYANGNITLIKNKETLSSLFTFVVDKELYLGSHSKGLMKLDKDTFNVVRNGDFFVLKPITGILSFSLNELIISTYSHGNFVYNIETGEVTDKLFSNQMKDLSKENFIYHSIKLPEDQFAFATLYGGILIMNDQGQLVEKYDKNSGLQDETVAFLYHNPTKGMEGTLWAALSNGISSIEFNSPLRIFGEESGLKGSVFDVIRFRDILFVATSTDVFYYNEVKNEVPQFIPLNIRTECWRFLEFFPPGERKSKLLVGTSTGVFEISENKIVKNITSDLKEASFYTFSLYQSKENPNNVILGLNTGVEIINYSQGSWSSYGNIPNVNDQIRSIAEDSEGNIWLSTQVNGIIKAIKIENEYTLIRYNQSHGFVTLKDIQIYEYEDRLVFATREGLYKFDNTREIFIPDNTFGAKFGDGSIGIYKFSEEDKNIWISGNEGEIIGLILKTENGKFDFVHTPFRRIPKRSSPAIFPDKDEIVWFGNAFNLLSFNKNVNRSYTDTYSALIRNITIGQDSVLFNGTFFRTVDNRNIVSLEQPDEMKVVLRYAYNNVTFEFVAPFFENEENIQYSYKLEGFNNVWSRWSSENKAVYTNLPEGDYIFKVKTLNVYEQESLVASYRFTVLPPWYRSILAFIIYFVLAALFVWGIVVLNSRRLQREKIILEGIVRERTAEVVKQKEEIEQQRDMIAEQNKNITDSIEYARRIQSAILPPGDYIKELFPQRFILYLPRDIVSGDFYWLTKKNKQIISVAADCTGHGVPGGFMSMLGIAFLNEIVNKSEILHSNEILNQLRQQVITSLHQTGKMGEAQDGMDVSLYILDHEEKKLQFSGANNPLIIIRNNEFIEIKGDKMPIGIHTRADEPFTNHEIELLEGDVVYSFTDGYQDQFGGKRGKKFMSKNFKDLLLKIHKKPMDKQKEILEKTLVEWQGSFERVDDVLVMGVKI